MRNIDSNIIDVMFIVKFNNLQELKLQVHGHSKGMFFLGLAQNQMIKLCACACLIGEHLMPLLVQEL